MKSDEFNRATKTDDEEEIPVEVFPKDNFDRINFYVKEMREPTWKEAKDVDRSKRTNIQTYRPNGRQVFKKNFEDQDKTEIAKLRHEDWKIKEETNF
jgi:uncharacterized protein YxeA